jgi:histone arginine demethylase JMJD6
MSERCYAVPVKANLSNEEFLYEHVLARQPVVIKGALTTWNAMRWTPEYLKAKAGARRVCYRTQGEPETATFGDLIDRIFDGPSQGPAPYLRNINLAEQLPELVEDTTPEPVYSHDNWRSHVLMPSGWPRSVKKGAYELFVSRTAASFPYLHIDYWGMSAFFAQICGEKEVILFPPEDAPNLYTTAGDPLVSEITDFDELAYPKLKATRQHRVTIGPGDLLYNPAWWHTTKTTRTAITLIWAYWNRHEWTHLLTAVRNVGLRGRLFAPYLWFVGVCNRFGTSVL